jgi:hypothetical protein
VLGVGVTSALALGQFFDLARDYVLEYSIVFSVFFLAVVYYSGKFPSYSEKGRLSVKMLIAGVGFLAGGLLWASLNAVLVQKEGEDLWSDVSQRLGEVEEENRSLRRLTLEQRLSHSLKFEINESSDDGERLTISVSWPDFIEDDVTNCRLHENRDEASFYNLKIKSCTEVHIEFYSDVFYSKYQSGSDYGLNHGGLRYNGMDIAADTPEFRDIVAETDGLSDIIMITTMDLFD